MPFSRSRSIESMTRSTTAWLRGRRRSGGASRRRAWSCRGRRGRRWRRCAGRCGGGGALVGVAWWRRARWGRGPREWDGRLSHGGSAERGAATHGHSRHDRRRRDPVRHRPRAPSPTRSASPASGAVETCLVRRRAADRRPVAGRRRRGRGRAVGKRGGPRHPAPAGERDRPARWSAARSSRFAEVSETTAVLLWPARMTWVGPETITSLIEAHGWIVARDAATDLARRAGLAGAARGGT